METEVVIARACGGEPLRRIAVSHSETLIYLAAPDRVAAVKSMASIPIGFPIRDVFAFNEALFERLRQQWEGSGMTDPSLWRVAEPYRPVTPPGG